MISEKLVRELAEERIAELDNGLFIVEIKISSSNQINVLIDSSEGSVAITDCISVSRNIEHNLDREEQDFELSVSSPGLDQPLRMVPQYVKNVGRDVKVKLNDENGKLEGLLKHADDNGIIVETTRKERIEGRKKKETIVEEHPLQYDDIKETKIVISFK